MTSLLRCCSSDTTSGIVNGCLHMTSPGSPPMEAALRAGSPPPRGARDTPGAELDPEIRLLIRRAAALPRGLALLHRAPLECAAVLLSAHPDCVARARAALEDREARAAALGEFVRAARPGSRAPAGTPRPAPRPRSPEELMRTAYEQHGRADVLASASLEYAAVVFGVHPELVLAVRELVAKRGIPIALPGDT